MLPFRTRIAIALVWAAAPALAGEPALDAAALMREALELHAPLPALPPELHELRPVSPPALPGDDARDSALAAAAEARRGAVERATEAAARAAIEALPDDGPAAAAAKVDADVAAAIDVGRAAATRGVPSSLPVTPLIPRR